MVESFFRELMVWAIVVLCCFCPENRVVEIVGFHP